MAVTPNEVAALDRRLDGFLADLTESLGRSERHRWAKVYLQGLLMDGGHKSIEPMAERISGADVQSLRQFVGQSPWAVEQIQQKLAEKVADLMAEPEVWMIDETSFPKAGDASVGVARQYCGTLGKVANCQDHYEGRHWLGWHHHVTLVMHGLRFLTHQAQAKNFWCDAGAPTANPSADTGSANPSGGTVPVV